MIEGHERQIGRFAWVMAWVGLVVGQLHALARFRTADGLEDIDPDNYPLTAAWAVPADDLLSPLLDWGDPDLVYVHLREDLVPGLPGVHAVRRSSSTAADEPAGFEKWVWLANIALFAAVTFGVFLDLLDAVDGRLRGRRDRGGAVHGRHLVRLPRHSG